eukprot:2446881-Pleurochrysis_carterae.AAC.3
MMNRFANHAAGNAISMYMYYKLAAARAWTGLAASMQKLAWPELHVLSLSLLRFIEHAKRRYTAHEGRFRCSGRKKVRLTALRIRLNGSPCSFCVVPRWRATPSYTSYMIGKSHINIANKLRYPSSMHLTRIGSSPSNARELVSISSNSSISRTHNYGTDATDYMAVRLAP